MMRALLAVSAAIVVISFASLGFAGEVGGGNPAVFALHVKAHTNKSCTETVNPQTTDCSTYSVSGALQTNYDVYLVVAGGDTASIDGFKGASCGIQYNGNDAEGVDVFQWTPCCDLDFPNGTPEWPASGGGNRMTWVLCQNTETTSGYQSTFGAFYIFAYSDDSFQLTPNLNVAFPELAVNNCAGADLYLDFNYLARVDFGAGAPGASPNPGSGCNPCLEQCPFSTPVVPTTWGSVKTRFGNY